MIYLQKMTSGPFMTLFMTDFQHSSQGENQEKHCNEISCISVELDEEQRESKVETIAYLARLYLSHEEKKPFHQI